MTDKQITIDYKNLCENYSKEVGCYNTFYGSCIKEQCFTYRLLQLLKRKEQECEELKEKYKWYDHYKEQALYNKNLCNKKSEQLDQLKADNNELRNFHINLVGVKECNIRELLKLKQALTEIKEVAENSCCSQPTSTCEEYENCKGCSRTSDDKTIKQILQKIREVE